MALLASSSIKMDELLVDWLVGSDEMYEKVLQRIQELRVPHAPAQPHPKIHIPRIVSLEKPTLAWNDIEERVNYVFANNPVTPDAFLRITTDVCGFPRYFHVPFVQRIHDWNRSTEANISLHHFKAFWMQFLDNTDIAERYFHFLKQPDVDYLARDDFLPLLKVLLVTHPGLEFLASHQEFQEKYAISVVTRIFYFCDKSHSGKITLRQFKQSDLIQVLQSVDQEEEINKITRYFSYEHFYVLYCRFWELGMVSQCIASHTHTHTIF